MSSSSVISSHRSILGYATTLLVFLQSALVITGGAVRLTGSGLGCPTWPECTPGSYTPVRGQIEDPLHVWIEFGNRLLTFLLLANALIVLLIILKKGVREFRLLAFGQIAGILGQGLLGGITVLTDLNPFSVAGHFLLSMVLIAGALSLRQRVVGKSPTGIDLLPLSKKIGRGVILVLVLVLVSGTIVTGSGPHAGDIRAKRTGFDPATMTWIHADFVIVLFGMIVAFFLVCRLSEDPLTTKVMNSKIQRLFFICLAQGAIGYIQYFTGLPEIIVAAHLLGAICVWLSAWDVAITGNLFPRKKRKKTGANKP